MNSHLARLLATRKLPLRKRSFALALAVVAAIAGKAAAAEGDIGCPSTSLSSEAFGTGADQLELLGK